MSHLIELRGFKNVITTVDNVIYFLSIGRLHNVEKLSNMSFSFKITFKTTAGKRFYTILFLFKDAIH